MRRVMICSILGIGLVLGGCAQDGYGPKETGGALLGGVGGALLGSRFGKGSGALVTTAIGALGGAFLGSSIGRSMDKTDRLYAERSASQAFETYPSGRSAEWRNPDTGNYGTVTPTRTYEQSGRYCREYETTINVGGRAERGYGTACRQPDGTWQVVSG